MAAEPPKTKMRIVPGDFLAGMIMGQEGSVADGEYPIAMLSRGGKKRRLNLGFWVQTCCSPMRALIKKPEGNPNPLIRRASSNSSKPISGMITAVITMNSR